jgi:hypothetical protein
MDAEHLKEVVISGRHPSIAESVLYLLPSGIHLLKQAAATSSWLIETPVISTTRSYYPSPSPPVLPNLIKISQAVGSEGNMSRKTSLNTK